MTSPPPLRVAFVVSSRVPRWLSECAQELQSAHIAKAIVVLELPAGASPATLWTKFRSGIARWLFELYLLLDRRRFRQELGLMDSISLKVAFPSCPTLNLLNSPKGSIESSLKELNLDVIWDPFSVADREALAPFSRYGIWNLRFGDEHSGYTPIPGFWEVAGNNPVTKANLMIFKADPKSETILDILSMPTHSHSVARSQANVYSQVSQMWLEKMRALWEEGPSALRSKGALASKPILAAPGNIQMVHVLAKMAKRALLNRYHVTFFHGQWSLAYQWDDLPINPKKLNFITPPADRFWADPFPVLAGGQYHIFHEEVPFATSRGSIAVTTIDAEGQIKSTVPALVLDYHLSYPFIFEWNGGYYMLPESSEARRIDLYRSTAFPLGWKLEKTLISDIMAFDSTLAYISDRWWLFTSLLPRDQSNLVHELHLYHAPSPLGPWTPHRRNPVKRFNVTSTRPAGQVFEKDGVFYRPAQDCSKRYGYGISINRILRISPDEYEEIENQKILPDWHSNLLGVHTLNRAGGMLMIDCLIRRRKNILR